jgi:hypothetical protein
MEMNYFSIKKIAQNYNSPVNPMVTQLIRNFKLLRLPSLTAITPGEAAELENMQYQIRVLLRKPGMNLPASRIRN